MGCKGMRGRKNRGDNVKLHYAFCHQVKKAFDPRRMTVTHHIRSGGSISGFLPAFAFLRMFEEGAVPMKCGMFNMFSDAVVNSAKWIAPFAPLWSLFYDQDG